MTKQQERELKDLEQKYQELFDAVNDSYNSGKSIDEHDDIYTQFVKAHDRIEFLHAILELDEMDAVTAA